MTVLNAAKNMLRIRNLMEINSLSNDVRFLWLKKAKNNQNSMSKRTKWFSKPRRDGGKTWKRDLSNHTLLPFFCSFLPLHSKCRSCDSPQCKLYVSTISQEWELFFLDFLLCQTGKQVSFYFDKSHKKIASATHAHTHKRPTERIGKKINEK